MMCACRDNFDMKSHRDDAHSWVLAWRLYDCRQVAAARGGQIFPTDLARNVTTRFASVPRNLARGNGRLRFEDNGRRRTVAYLQTRGKRAC